MFRSQGIKCDGRYILQERRKAKCECFLVGTSDAFPSDGEDASEYNRYITSALKFRNGSCVEKAAQRGAS
jgi:hypothetical protein